eukprot:GHUV01016360.1.p1 GENE.GHUV01016360.1~~GHUV01016360.1.p1  ORF type:complete len:286 (+),score=79.01 GHUV01016360.1:781-1638(+)
MAPKAAPNPVEDAILQLCAQYPNGTPNEQVTGPTGPLSSFDLSERVQALNKLLASHKLSILQQGNQLLYRAAAPQDARMSGMSPEEMLVYQAIKESGTKGCWTRDMKVKTNLAQPQITKILKALETRQLVKSVKNVNNPSRKIYMLYELQPDQELTGGAWYSDSQLDQQFIDVLREACYRLIDTSQDHPTVKDIHAFIHAKGLARVQLKEQDILTLLQTLIADGRIESIFDDQDEERFRPVVLPLPDDTPLTGIPCGVCPVMDQCHEGGQISPQTCIYYKSWLEF